MDRRDEMIKLMRDSGIAEPEAFIERLIEENILDDEYRFNKEEMQTLMDASKENEIYIDIKSEKGKDVLGVINTYPGLTLKIITLAFDKNEVDKVKKAIEELIDKHLIYTEYRDGREVYYPTLAITEY